MSPISGTSINPTSNFGAQPQTTAPDKATEATSAESLDKSTFGEADVQKPQNKNSECAKCGDAKGGEEGGAGDIMKMLKELLESIMKILGMDKKQGAGDSAQAAGGGAPSSI
jgi:hypothetical protein